MATYGTLKAALAEFRRRGDGRWAAKADVPTDEAIEAKVRAAVAEAGVAAEPLTDSDMDEVFGALDPGGGE